MARSLRRGWRPWKGWRRSRWNSSSAASPRGRTATRRRSYQVTDEPGSLTEAELPRWLARHRLLDANRLALAVLIIREVIDEAGLIRECTLERRRGAAGRTAARRPGAGGIHRPGPHGAHLSRLARRQTDRGRGNQRRAAGPPPHVRTPRRRARRPARPVRTRGADDRCARADVVRDHGRVRQHRACAPGGRPGDRLRHRLARPGAVRAARRVPAVCRTAHSGAGERGRGAGRVGARQPGAP